MVIPRPASGASAEIDLVACDGHGYVTQFRYTLTNAMVSSAYMDMSFDHDLVTAQGWRKRIDHASPPLALRPTPSDERQPANLDVSGDGMVLAADVLRMGKSTPVLFEAARRNAVDSEVQGGNRIQSEEIRRLVPLPLPTGILSSKSLVGVPPGIGITVMAPAGMDFRHGHIDPHAVRPVLPPLENNPSEAPHYPETFTHGPENPVATP